MNAIKKIVSVFIILILATDLSGCAFTRIYSDSYNPQLNLNKPSLTSYDNVYVYGPWSSQVSENLMKTGLFKSARITQSRQPLASGLYISIEESYSNIEDGGANFLLLMISFGLFPVQKTDTYTYSVKIFENGVPLNSGSQFTLRYRNTAGLVALFIPSDSSDKAAEIVTNQVITSLNKKN